MSATITKIAGPSKVPGKGVEYSFSVLLDTVHASGGEAIDLTSYLGYLYGGTVDGVDAIADTGYRFSVVGPGRATALTSSNVLISAKQSPAHTAATTAATALTEAASVDLSGVGALIITVWGKAAITTSWA